MSSRAGALALTTLIDPAWCAKRLSEGGGSMTVIEGALENSEPNVVRSAINPLIDLEFIADRYLDGATRLSALEVAVRYSRDLLPLGVSPHPLIDGDLFRICNPRVAAQEQSGAIRSWVDSLLNEADQSERGILPFLDPGFFLSQTGIGRDALASRGIKSVSRLYLGEAAYQGVRPHPLFDPIFVFADRQGVLPSKAELKNAGAFLVRELRLYTQQAMKDGRASPSIGFDEELLRANPFVARAIEEGRYVNAFHAYSVNTARMAAQVLSKTGIGAFPECLTPRPWWKQNWRSPKPRGRARIERSLLRASRQRLFTLAPRPVMTRIDGDLPHEVRVGQKFSIIVHGYAMSPAGRLLGVELKVGQQRIKGSFQGFPRPDVATAAGSLYPAVDRLFCGFAVAWSGAADETGNLSLRLRFRVGGKRRARLSQWVEAGSIRVTRPIVRVRAGSPAKVAIAMATYNPKSERFAQQLRSIQAQTLTDWTLVISDESTSLAAREAIAEYVKGDDRITLTTGRRLGFLGNFERALNQLDRRSPFFALSDQDDVWLPEKLDRLVAALEAERSALAYGGMKIVSENGNLLEDSFFSWRQQHRHSANEILLVNTITGAACVGRMDLLRIALPIPRYTGVFHDMWLALVATRQGGITFVDRNLQDYVQHGENVLGQDSEKDRLAASRFAQDRKILEDIRHRVSQGVSALEDAEIHSICSVFFPAIVGVWPAAVQREFLNLALAHRFGGKVTKDPLATSRLAIGAKRRIHVADSDSSRTFLNIPGWLAVGTDTLAEVTSARPLSQRLADATLKTAEGQALVRARVSLEPHAALKEKIRADFRVTGPSAFDVTMLIPEIRREVVFAGYLAKFHLARRLAQLGLRVRLALVDQDLADLQSQIEIAHDHPELHGLFNEVSVEQWGDRSRAISLAPQEALIATTWWSAHIAHKLRPDRRFLYFIQEWEPLTVPQGSWAALAEQSYSLPHNALFSTSILASFFRQRGLSIFAPSRRAEGARGVSFQHPATPPRPDEVVAEQLRERTIVCYARPEGHAARNLFDILVMGLEEAFALLGPRRHSWRAIGIGAAKPTRIPIGDQTLNIIERGSMADYRQLLARSRVGVAPMYAPHPSIVPLDMAAAGLEVITTKYSTKSQASFRRISSRIFCVEPRPIDLGRAIAEGVLRADRQGPHPFHFAWPISWEKALGPAKVQTISTLLL